MSDTIRLTLRAPLERTLEVEGLTPDRLSALSEQEIASLPAWLGSNESTLGEFFEVRGAHAARVHLSGDLARVDGIGAGAAGGELVIDGNAGRRVGEGMTGGRIEVKGNAGDEAGLAMGGGMLRIQGDAGDRVGAARAGASKGMTGGEILVAGSVGREAAAHARRGLVVVSGAAGADAARGIIAGTLLVLGRIGPNPGRGSKRGSIIACGGIDLPATYQYACTFRPPHVRLTFIYLRRQYGVAIEQRLLDGPYRRYCGDAGDPGKGEILEFPAD